MLTKLLKYEFRASFRELGPLYAALLGVAFLVRPSFYRLDFSGTITGMTMIVYTALMIAVLVVSCITIIQRFTKTMLGSEGYLMHTLPVSASTHILSKLIVAMVIVVAGIVVGMFSILITAMDKLVFQVFWEEVLAALYDIFGSYGPLAAIEMVLLGIFGYAQGILMIYTAACIGHLFPRGRALISVLSFIAMSSVLGEITDLLQELFQQVVGESYGSYSHYMSLLPELVTSVLICIGLFCAVRYVLENRLNLD